MSPDQKHIARVLRVGCGATGNDVTWVTLTTSANPENNDNSVLVLDGDVSESCSLEWQNNYTLNISCKKHAEFFSGKEIADGVRILYE